MNINNNDGVSNIDDLGQLGAASQHKDGLPESSEKNIARRESAVIDDEAAALSREKLVTAREDAADLRGNAADLREDAADLRENAADSREDAANLRGNAADLREDAANLRENAVHQREGIATSREDAADLRGNVADSREEAADLRGNAADLREDAANLREDAVHQREGTATSREDAADLRGNAADSREDAANLRENAADSREDAANLRENAADLREDAADLRGNTADLREDAVHLREGTVTSREREIRAAETIQAASDDHVIRLQQANANLVISTIEAHKQAEEAETAKIQLDYLAHHDILTGLPNRMLLQDRLSQSIDFARRQGRQLAVMFMDLDRFKHINDTLGHAAGDQLLQSVAQCLVSCVRQSDTISRQGGDEFVLLLPYIDRAEDAALCAQKMLAALALPHCIDQHDLQISVSIGISIYPDDGQDAETLIKNADTAMYYAKENGRNNYKFFKQDMNDLAVQLQSIEASLRRALERQEFILHYQPKINLQSGAIVSVEALIRWQHPERGLLPPEQFVFIAEDCGLILPIGRWVLREACLQARAWLQAGLPPITVAVNTSSLEFRAKDFLENIRATLEDTCLEPCYLELELTESVLMRDAESTDSVLHALADLGVKLAIDDFGTGYSSLRYLRQFPIDALKIDQSFVNRMTCNPDDASIVSAVISMGKSLKKRVIAEGVETPEQYALLLAEHCDEGQGYYFGRPVAAEALATLLQTGLSLTPPD